MLNQAVFQAQGTKQKAIQTKIPAFMKPTSSGRKQTTKRAIQRIASCLEVITVRDEHRGERDGRDQDRNGGMTEEWR